jgi:DNA gyrase/topoisomerase IV subunit B
MLKGRRHTIGVSVCLRGARQAYLNAGLKIELVDERLAPFREEVHRHQLSNKRVCVCLVVAHTVFSSPPLTRLQMFCHRGGISEYVETICEGKTALVEVLLLYRIGARTRFLVNIPCIASPRFLSSSLTSPPLLKEPSVFFTSRTVRNVIVEIALRWNSDMYSDSIISFANGVHTANGGTHTDGLKSALTRVLNAQARISGKLKDKSANLAGDFIREGLCAIVSVKMQEAEFEGQTKNRLGSPEVRGIVNEVTAEFLTAELQRRPKVSDGSRCVFLNPVAADWLACICVVSELMFPELTMLVANSFASPHG